MLRSCRTLDATLHAIEEIFAVGFYRDCVRLLGKPTGLQVWLSLPPPPHVARYRALTPIRFHFSASPLPEVRCTSPRTYRKAARGERASPGASRSDTL